MLANRLREVGMHQLGARHEAGFVFAAKIETFALRLSEGGRTIEQVSQMGEVESAVLELRSGGDLRS